ncbi:MAG: hypothetical protein ACP5MG_08215 [Verrucomicrobiia bacterium]
MDKQSLFLNLKNSLGKFLGKTRTRAIATPLIINPQKIPYGSFKFQIKSAAGAEFQIYASTNLITWINIAQGKTNQGIVDYVDPEASRLGYRFYRVVVNSTVSENIIGYVTINLPPGFAMIANPFKNQDNTIQRLLADMPDGTTFNKFDNLKFKLVENQLKNGRWSHPNDIFSPGEGAIIYNPMDEYRPLCFAGEVLQGQILNPIPAGFSIKSSMLPQAGRLHDDLQFPVADGDIIHIFDRDRQKYNVFCYDPKQWSINPPIVGIGESFWVGKKSPANWIRTYNPPPLLG